jgi:hypothetical protein
MSTMKGGPKPHSLNFNYQFAAVQLEIFTKIVQGTLSNASSIGSQKCDRLGLPSRSATILLLDIGDLTSRLNCLVLFPLSM